MGVRLPASSRSILRSADKKGCTSKHWKIINVYYLSKSYYVAIIAAFIYMKKVISDTWFVVN